MRTGELANGGLFLLAIVFKGVVDEESRCFLCRWKIFQPLGADSGIRACQRSAVRGLTGTSSGRGSVPSAGRLLGRKSILRMGRGEGTASGVPRATLAASGCEQGEVEGVQRRAVDVLAHFDDSAVGGVAGAVHGQERRAFGLA